MSFVTVLRSLTYLALQCIITPPFALISLATFPLSPLNRYRVISRWSVIMIYLLRVVCGIHYRVQGAEHIPSTPAVILSKHQSAWETLALQIIFPPQVWVLKRELLLVPFFGWGLAMTSPIAINRKSGKVALEQIVEQGRDRLQKGFCVVVFPEGTRIAPGERGKYRIGGAWLATHTRTPVIPVAHNAGEFWGKNSFLKLPGTISIHIGAPISPEGLKPEELNAKVEAWIESEMQIISQKKQARGD